MNEDLQNLMKYKEFYALKTELISFVNTLRDELEDLNVSDQTFAFQAGVKISSINALQNFLTELGIVKDADFKKVRKTYE